MPFTEPGEKACKKTTGFLLKEKKNSEYDGSLMSNGMGGSVLGELMGLGDMEGNTLNAFDFWAVDFREVREKKERHFLLVLKTFTKELSGLSGVLLEKQSEFVVDAVHTILHHYAHSFIPRVQRARSVILIGHSMGGIVALSATGNARLAAGSVASILCLATPLTPVLLADAAIAGVYRKIEGNGEKSDESFLLINFFVPASLSTLSNVSIALIGGGQRDWFVPSRLSVPPRWFQHPVFYIDALSISKAHVDPDHQCIVWCNQIVRAVVGALFRSLDPKSRMLYQSPDARTKVA